MRSVNCGLGIAVLVCLALSTLCAQGSTAVPAFNADWDLYSDTWVATDALGRKLPGYAECGPPRRDKTVGVFYFHHGANGHQLGGPYDITKILAKDPDNPQWGPREAHWWGEPEAGYYIPTDPWVIRRNLSMLADAGVDTIIFDTSNAGTYPDAYMPLCEVAMQMRALGMRTPQVSFLTHHQSPNRVKQLYDELYSKNLYSDLWFRWQGRPLALGLRDGKMTDGTQLPQEIKDFFTWRESWFDHPAQGWFGDGKDKWPWGDYYPQGAGWHTPGVPEAMAVSIATHPTMNIGRSYSHKRQPPVDKYGLCPTMGQGLFFAEQWSRALEVDPQFIWMTGWNEWTAGKQIAKKDGGRCGGRTLKTGDAFFVDLYTQEFSRDAEPMKGGHTDNYYYQMIGNIRRYKGVRPPPKASPEKSIAIDGSFRDWDAVAPEFRDTIGDTLHRDWDGWGSLHYTNTTGRNDFVRAKVARDAERVFFYVETRAPITPRTDRNWMMLFIDGDGKPRNGWNGYDHLINWPVLTTTTTTVKRCAGGWNWKTVGSATYCVKGNRMELAVPRRLIGQSSGDVAFDFHWADNVQKPGDIIEFAVSGDSAPNRRFNYRYATASNRVP